MALGRKKTWHFQEFIILITSSFIAIPHHHKADLGQLISPQKATFHALRWCEYRWISSYIGQPPIIGYRGPGCAICALCQKSKTIVQRLSLKTTFQLIGFNLSTKHEFFSLVWLYLWIFSNFVQVSIIVGVQPLAVPERQRLDSATMLSRIKLVKHTSWRILLNKKTRTVQSLFIYLQRV